jgi:hypothetical protein
MHRQHNAGAFLDRAEDLAPLMPKARHLLELRRAVMQLLPDSLSRLCVVANDRQGRVVIFAENSAVAAKLKLLAPALRNRLSEAGRQVTSVVIEVQPPAPPERAQIPREPPPSDAAAEIAKLAERIADPALKQALLRLASRAGKKNRPGNR